MHPGTEEHRIRVRLNVFWRSLSVLILLERGRRSSFKENVKRINERVSFFYSTKQRENNLKTWTLWIAMELRQVAFDIQRELVKKKKEEKRKLKIRLRKMECRWNSAQLDSNSETLARWNLITGSKYSASNNNRPSQPLQSFFDLFNDFLENKKKKEREKRECDLSRKEERKRREKTCCAIRYVFK